MSQVDGWRELNERGAGERNYSGKTTRYRESSGERMEIGGEQEGRRSMRVDS